MTDIEANLREIKENISEAADKRGAKYTDITLVGVTKTIDAERINPLVELGVKNIGENRVQELTAKYPLIEGNPNWHMIGSLQKNKIKYIIDKVCLIQSVDTIELAEAINKLCVKNNVIMDILLEVNIGNELSKHGFSPDKVIEGAQRCCEFSNIRLKGLMTVAPFAEISERNRDCFKKMYHLFIDTGEKVIHNSPMDILSMGMTGDYKVAIEEGANMIRVGTGLFGERV